MTCEYKARNDVNFGPANKRLKRTAENRSRLARRLLGGSGLLMAEGKEDHHVVPQHA